MRTKTMIGVIVGGGALAAVAVLAGLIGWLGAGPGSLAGILIAATVVGTYVAAIGPWQRRWGATDDEVGRAMPGDDLLPSDAANSTRAITIDAPPERVFPWLLQIGYGRGGWYSYDWLDNDGQPSASRIEPELQRLAPGDRIEMMPGFGPTVREIEPNHHIVSAGDADSWCLMVERIEGDRSRLISRWRQDWPRTPATFVWIAIADPGAFVMEQKMLRTIRRHAEGRTVDEKVTS